MPGLLPQMDPRLILQLQEAAANGDPGAQQQLQQLRGQMPGAGGAPPMGPAGAMPPAGGMPGAGGPPPMSQSQFGNGAPVSPDVKARQAQQLIQMLRARGMQ